MSNRDLQFILSFKNEASKTLQAAKKDLDALGKEAKDVAIQAQLLAKSGNDIDRAFAAVNKTAQQTKDQMLGVYAGTTNVTSAFKALNQASQQQNAANKQITESGLSITNVWAQVRNILLAVGAIQFGRKVIGEIAGFEQAMAEVRAVAGGTREDFQLLQQAALDVGSKSIVGATGAAQALKALAQAGFSTNEAVQALPGTLALAAAGGLDISKAAEIASVTVRQFNLTTAETSHVADVLAEAANRTNADVTDMGDAFGNVGSLGANMKETLEGTAAAIGILSNSGIKGAEAGTNLRNTLVSLINPTGDAQKTILSLNNAITGQRLTLKDVNPAYHSLSDILRALGDSAKDTTVAAKIFDARNINAVGILARNVDKMDELADSFKKVQGSAASMGAIMTDTIIGDFKLLGAEIEKITVDFGESSGLRNGIKTTLATLTLALGILNGDFQTTGQAAEDYANKLGMTADQVKVLFSNANTLATTLRITGTILKGFAEVLAGVAVAFATIRIGGFIAGLAAMEVNVIGLVGAFVGLLTPLNLFAAALGVLTVGFLAYGKTSKEALQNADEYKRNIDGLTKGTDDYTAAVKNLTQAQKDRIVQEATLGKLSAQQASDAAFSTITSAATGVMRDLKNIFSNDTFAEEVGNLTVYFKTGALDVDTFRKSLTALAAVHPDHLGEAQDLLKLLNEYQDGKAKVEDFQRAIDAASGKTDGINKQTDAVKKDTEALQAGAAAAVALANALQTAGNVQLGDLSIKLSNVNAQIDKIKTGGIAAGKALAEQQQATDEFFKNVGQADPSQASQLSNQAGRDAFLKANPEAAVKLQQILDQASAYGKAEAELAKLNSTTNKSISQADSFNKSLAEQIAAMNTKAKVAGLSQKQQERAIALDKVEQDAIKAGIKNFDVSEYAKAYDDMIAKQKSAQADFFGGFKTAIQNFIDNAKTAAQLAGDVFNEIADGVGNAISGIVDGSINSFSDLKSALGKILASIAADITKYLFGQGIGALLTSFTGGGGGGGITSNVTLPSSTPIIWNAKGNAFANGYKQHAYAKGGVVNSATPFSLAGGQQGLMGEAGAEGILPLKRLSNGALGVQAIGSQTSMRGTTLSYSATFEINIGGDNQGGANASTAEQQKQMGDVLNNAVKATVVETIQNMQRNGGILRNNRVIR